METIRCFIIYTHENGRTVEQGLALLAGPMPQATAFLDGYCLSTHHCGGSRSYGECEYISQFENLPVLFKTRV